MKAIIVEDSRLARLELKELLKAHPQIEVVAEAEAPDEAIALINELMPDVVFLDIHLPHKDGFAVLEELEFLPQVIFTTAFDQYAIKSFEYNALDYLLKPINEDRLTKAIGKLKKSGTPATANDPSPLSIDNRIFIKDGEQCWILDLKEVRFFESCGNYTHVYFGDNKPLIYKSLNKIEEKLDDKHFFRASRQHIVNLKFIQDVAPWMNGNLLLTMDDTTQIEISRRNTATFKRLLSL